MALTARPASRASRAVRRMSTFPVTFEAGRYADAVKVIRKNNPLPLVCGLVCEHPCEMHCRRGMVDDPMNILALKRFAVEHSDLNDHKPHVVDNTGKRVSVIGGGPA